ncbi:uncharacterized protein LOC133357245 isoform X2 [Lethenteron reissneri]|uniref:uncharacterized protein LOC133357115 isoform X2 n=1 Tax=Lethenteron reissneri TaxID=7753 RepID=UPI002AB6CED1|nr:uncharacterized protein LOC133357115 isoform X2 [Lethenteron reissneri]XP_061431065.1 uncharacterized protein LOC133357245 isoform X2 [Lethenteron reissneri]
MGAVGFQLLVVFLLLSIGPPPALGSNIVTTAGKTVHLPCPSGNPSERNGTWRWYPDLQNDEFVSIATFGQAAVTPSAERCHAAFARRMDVPGQASRDFSLRIVGAREEDTGVYVCTLSSAHSSHVTFETELRVDAAPCNCPRSCPHVLWLVPVGIGIGMVATVPLLSCLCDTALNYNRRPSKSGKPSGSTPCGL